MKKVLFFGFESEQSRGLVFLGSARAAVVTGPATESQLKLSARASQRCLHSTVAITELDLAKLANKKISSRRLRAKRHRPSQGSAQAPGPRLHHGSAFPRPPRTALGESLGLFGLYELIHSPSRSPCISIVASPCLRRPRHSIQQSNDLFEPKTLPAQGK